MDNQGGFNLDWGVVEMLAFNGHLIDESEVECQWIDHGTCNDIIKAKDFRAHLHHSHGVTTDSQLYSCRWHECSSAPMKKTSLERHMKEQHVPVKWACPKCPLTFTRERTLREHFGRTHGDA